MTDLTASVVLATARGDGPHLTLAGDLDSLGAARLRAVLEDEVAPGTRLSLDLSRVTHLSSEALAVLTQVFRRQRGSGGAVVLQAASDAVIRTLRVSGLHRVITVQGTSAVHVAPPELTAATS